MTSIISTDTDARNALLSLVALMLCVIWFELTPTDLWLQSWFFDPSTGTWLWSRDEPLGRLLLYDGIKRLLIVFGLGVLATLVATRNSNRYRPYRSGMRILVASLILVPATVGGLKATSNVACPRDLAEYGGSESYVGILGSAPAVAEGAAARRRCFPAGHASGGFALLALPFLFTDARRRRAAVLTALTVGWAMGAYKMVIGDHFLSHTVVTMLLAWLIVNCLAMLERRYQVVSASA